MSMNIFRLVGDCSHIAAVVLLLKLMFVQKNAKGVSLRTQELFLLVFLTRYLDLFTTFYSLYNSAVKILYLGATSALVYKFQHGVEGYDQARDVFPHIATLVLPCVVLSTISHLVGSGARNFDLLELLWTFSIFLESVAIVPQLVLLQKYRDVEPTLAQALLLMGLYRGLYIFNWVYRAHTEKGYQHHWLVYISGVVQVLMYADFFYSYSLTCRAASESADDGEQESHQPPNMAYKPLLQSHICCCDHVAKDDDQSPVDDASDDNNEGVRAANSSAVAPPALIFSRWTTGYMCCSILVSAVSGEPVICLVLILVPVLIVGLWEGLKGTMLARTVRQWCFDPTTVTEQQQTPTPEDTAPPLEEPLLPLEPSADLEEGKGIEQPEQAD